MAMEQYHKDQRCPVCHSEAIIKNTNGFLGLWVECPKCGVYVIEETVFNPSVFGLRLRACLYYYLTQQSEALKEKKLIPDFHNEEGEEFGIFDYWPVKLKPISTESILQLYYPQTIHDRIGMIMVNLSKELQYIGNTFTVNPSLGDPDKYHLFFLDDTFNAETIKVQYHGTIDLLKEKELIHPKNQKEDTTYKITTKGWEQIEDYQKSHENLHQGFIAMWFKDTMAPAKEAIMNAIKKSGYDPLPIDIKEHNNQIVPEIFFEIKRSEFVVADLTGQRGGVYYEAGFAEGLGKPVIMCCKADEFDDLHFDVKQKSAIIWSDEKDLEKKLMDRIKATIGKRNAV